MLHVFRATLSVLAVAAAGSLAPSSAHAQAPAPMQGGWSTGPQVWQVGTPPPMQYAPPSSSSSQSATDLEVGTLYGVAAGYGVGTGIWLDAELKIDDPGLKFLAPAILGVAAPVGVFFLDRPRMPRGMPAAIAAGMALGAGEGIGIASYQFVRSGADSEWGFRGFARSVFFGSTVGAGLGYVAAITMEPSPKTSILLGSSVMWGTIAGSMFGYGASAAGSDFGEANDSASLGGLIGYNAGLLGAAAVSTVWIPSYTTLTWMWIGFGAGVGVSTPIYLFYAGGDHDVRRGLIFQGTAGMLGLAAGGIFSLDAKDFGSSNGGIFGSNPTAPVRVTGGGFMPVPGGMGFQVSGILF
ncbi:MAG TPA: hypothetical protein VJT73_18130 [Polyangiaceae bacterium]|nr:hypothetical protein [Polyangiaceae bacterium]